MEKVGVYKEFSGPVSTQWLAKLGSSSWISSKSRLKSA